MSSVAPPPADLVTVNIDGRDIAVPKGTNVIEAARQLGIEIPHYCYHPKLSLSGNCRMCLIEMGLPAVDPATRTPLLDPATGRPRINWLPRAQIGCATNAIAGLHIRTDTPLVRDCREGVTEFLLVNHPLDCPICDQAGECRLQEHSTAYGRGYSRFVEQKNTKPKRTALGPRVTLDDERCILCSRCLRFCKEIARDDVLGFIDRGSHTTLTCYPGRQLENNYSLNTVDLCPVGALTSTDFRFRMRVWFLKATPGLDPESSVGANTEVWSREGVIYRITPRRNDEVNDTWMTDSGRLLYQQVRSADRLLHATVAGTPATPAAALARAGELLRAGAVAVVGSGRATVEEQYLARLLATALAATTHLVTRTGAGDGLLLSADRNPNLRGALVTGLLSALPDPGAVPPPTGPAAPPPAADAVRLGGLAPLAAAIDAGRVRTVLTVGEDLVAAGLTAAQLAQVAVICLGTHRSATSAAAQVVLPALTVFEKSGTFINQQFRLQQFAAAVPGPAGVAGDCATLAALLAAAGGPAVPAEPAALWAQLAAAVPVLAGLSPATLPPAGRLLDGSAWAGLPFVDGPSLHFQPAPPAAAANA